MIDDLIEKLKESDDNRELSHKLAYQISEKRITDTLAFKSVSFDMKDGTEVTVSDDYICTGGCEVTLHYPAHYPEYWDNSIAVHTDSDEGYMEVSVRDLNRDKQFRLFSLSGIKTISK